MAQQYGCWATGCRHLTEYVVTNPAVRLMRPVESCNDHLGDLLGNAAKAAFRTEANPPASVTLKIDLLAEV